MTITFTPVIGLITIVAVLAIISVSFIFGTIYRKKVSEAKIGAAEAEAMRIVNEAVKEAQARKKESLIEAKDEIFKLKSEADKEIKERRSDISRQEKRLIQKEENLDKKTAAIEDKDNRLTEKLKQIEAKQVEIETLKQSQFDMLERISGLSADQAKAELLSQVDAGLTHEKALKIRLYEEQLKDEKDELTRNLLSTCISRCAADHASEATVSVVALPNDEMKGRIIGREGRNIRTLETLTGVDLIIDDTPEAITLSSFDPVRREVARVALERLIADGRIHPSRIEEMVEKAKNEVDNTIKQAGHKAVLDLGLHGINSELVKLIGRLKYRTSYGQNVLNHSMEVAMLSGLLAAELGADVTLAKIAGLLHDIGKGLDHEMEGSHIQIGVDMAKRYKESNAVVHAIEAHHGDVEAKTVIACIVKAADAISAARPGARRENVENYIKRLQRLEEISNGFAGVEKTFAIQAGREIRVMVKPEQIKDDNMVILAHDIAQKIENELDYPGQIKVHIIRESRAFDFAK